MKKKKNYIFLSACILSGLIAILFFSNNGIGAGVSFIIIGISFFMLFNQRDKENPTAKNTKNQMAIEVVILVIVFLVLLLRYIQSFVH